MKTDNKSAGSSISREFAFDFAVRTNVGMKREENQDSYGLAQTQDASLFIVADGMGGAAGGAKASLLAVNIVSRIGIKPSGSLSPDSFFEAIRVANEFIHNQSQTYPQLQGMGTTLVMLGIVGRRALLANVGDSRIYFLRGGEFVQLTKDHTLVREMVEAGEITEEQAEDHPVAHMLTRALGGAPEVNPDVEFLEYPVEIGDRFLLCCDGLYNDISAEEIGQMVASLPPSEAVEKLVQLANSRGGSDNITVQILEVREAKPEDTSLLPDQGVIEISHSAGDFESEKEQFKHSLQEKIVTLEDEFTSELLSAEPAAPEVDPIVTGGSVLSSGQETFDSIILGMQDSSGSSSVNSLSSATATATAAAAAAVTTADNAAEAEPISESVVSDEFVSDENEVANLESNSELAVESLEEVSTEEIVSTSVVEEVSTPVVEENVQLEAKDSQETLENKEDPVDEGDSSRDFVMVEEEPSEVNFTLADDQAETTETVGSDPVKVEKAEKVLDKAEAPTSEDIFEEDSFDQSEDLEIPAAAQISQRSIPKGGMIAGSLLLAGLAGGWLFTSNQGDKPLVQAKNSIESPLALGELSIEEEKQRLAIESRAIAEEKIRLEEERQAFEADKRSQKIVKEIVPEVRVVTTEEVELVEQQEKAAVVEEVKLAEQQQIVAVKEEQKKAAVVEEVKLAEQQQIVAVEEQIEKVKEPIPEAGLTLASNAEDRVVAIDWEKEDREIKQAKKNLEKATVEPKVEKKQLILTEAEKRKVSLKKARVREKIASVVGKMEATKLQTDSEKTTWIDSMKSKLSVLDTGLNRASKNYRKATSSLKKWKGFEKMQGRTKPLTLAKKLSKEDGKLKSIVKQIEKLSLQYSEAAEGNLSDPATANLMIKLGNDVNTQKSELRKISKEIIDGRLKESQENLVEYARLKDELSTKKKILNKQIGTARTIKPGSRETGETRLKELSVKKDELDSELLELTAQLSDQQESDFKREQILRSGK